MPCRPRMNCGKNVRLKARISSRQQNRPRRVVVHPAGDLRPPVVQAAEEHEQGAAEHHVVEVGDDEVRVVDVEVRRQNGQRQTRQPADGEHEEEPQGVEHGRLQHDRTLVERGQPVPDLDRRGDGHQHRQRAEDRVRRARLPVGEHVVSPDEEADQGDGDAAHGHEAVAEDLAAAEGGDDLAHDAHGGQDHDVHGRVRVEPEEVLEEDRVAAVGRIENAGVEQPFHDQQQQRDRQHGRGQDLDQGRGIQGPGRTAACGTRSCPAAAACGS